MNARCDVIIPVKDAIWWVDKCLSELFRCTDPALLGRVLVVNDHSSSESSLALADLCSRFKSVELLQNEGAPGFGAACNLAAARSQASHLLFLNTDCLLSPRALEKLVLACERDSTIGLACPVSNNSPVLTLAMMPGRTYLEMNGLLERIHQDRPPSEMVYDACTVVGNCLLITRKCWEATGTFDQAWGLGYGEETDYQFRAMRLGFRGVVLANTYVFHFGNASFRYQTGSSELQKRNLELFHSKWGGDFIEYRDRCAKRDPIRSIEERLKQHQGEPVAADVLFILAGLSQTVGGVHIVIEICNYLVRNGVNAKCLVLGELSQAALTAYSEPILSGLLHCPDESRFLADHLIDTKLVVATLFSTAAPAYLFARMRGIPVANFVQGYEFLFENGAVRDRVEQSYELPDWVIVTTSWLEAGVRRRTPDKSTAVLPIGVDPYLFLPRIDIAGRPKVRLAVVLRTEPDKGQAILLEVLDQLLPYRDQLSLTVFLSEQPVPRGWFHSKDTELVRLPIDKDTFARHLRRCDLLADASLHEGFGLVPLEAMACGATVIASDSGGINEFLKDGQNGVLVKEVNKAERFVAEILSLVRDRQRLVALRREALNTARQYTASSRYQKYKEHFEHRIQQARSSSPEAPIIAWKTGDEGLRGFHQTLPNRDEAWVLKPKGHQPLLIIPEHLLPSGTALVLKLEVFSPLRQMLNVFYGDTLVSAGGAPEGDLLTYARSVARGIREIGRAWKSSIGRVLVTGSRAKTSQGGSGILVTKGWNELLIELPRQASGNPVRLAFGGRKESVLTSLQIASLPPSSPDVAPLTERLAASGSIAWELTSSTRPALLADGADLVPWPAGHFRSLGDDPGLLLPEAAWPTDGSVLGWIDFSVPADTMAQLYYMSASMTEFTEEASIQKIAKRGRNVFAVNLTANLRSRLRFDPGQVKGDYRIHAICLYSRRPSADAQTPIARSA